MFLNSSFETSRKKRYDDLDVYVCVYVCVLHGEGLKVIQATRANTYERRGNTIFTGKKRRPHKAAGNMNDL